MAAKSRLAILPLPKVERLLGTFATCCNRKKQVGNLGLHRARSRISLQ